MFCSGHTFFVQQMPAKLGLEPYVAHATFQFGELGCPLCSKFRISCRQHAQAQQLACCHH